MTPPPCTGRYCDVLFRKSGAYTPEIKGSELHMEKLSLDGGEVRVSGRVDTLSYEEKRASGGFFARLLGG